MIALAPAIEPSANPAVEAGTHPGLGQHPGLGKPPPGWGTSPRRLDPPRASGRASGRQRSTATAGLVPAKRSGGYGATDRGLVE